MKLCITISKYHSWYLFQISLQIMLLPILIKLTIQISQILNIMHCTKKLVFPLGKSLFCQNVWSGHCPAGQFWLLERALSHIIKIHYLIKYEKGDIILPLRAFLRLARYGLYVSKLTQKQSLLSDKTKCVCTCILHLNLLCL